MTFIPHAGISKWMRISQFRFTGVKVLKNTIFATFCAILVKIGPLQVPSALQSSNDHSIRQLRYLLCTQVPTYGGIHGSTEQFTFTG